MGGPKRAVFEELGVYLQVHSITQHANSTLKPNAYSALIARSNRILNIGSFDPFILFSINRPGYLRTLQAHVGTRDTGSYAHGKDRAHHVTPTL